MQVREEARLVPAFRRYPTTHCCEFIPCLYKTIDIVDEEEHIVALLSEVTRYATRRRAYE